MDKTNAIFKYSLFIASNSYNSRKSFDLLLYATKGVPETNILVLFATTSCNSYGNIWRFDRVLLLMNGLCYIKKKKKQVSS